jgi:hypothetical protein
MAKEATETKHTKHDSVIVNIPEKDPLGERFPGCWINGQVFEPGGSYTVSSEVAKELDRLIANHMDGSLRLLRGKVDLKALADIQRSRGYWAGIGSDSGQ